MRISGFARSGLAVLALTAVAACTQDTVTAPSADEPALSLETRASMGRHVFVLVEEDLPSPELLDEIELRGGEVERRYDDFGVLTVYGLDDEDASALAGRRDIEGVDRDMTVRWVPELRDDVTNLMEAPSALSDQSGAFYFALGMQWNMTQIRAPEAWQASGQGAGQVVAVLDSGIDPFHIDLAGKVHAASVSALSPGSSPCGQFDEENIYDLGYHGTFVAGLISSNGLGMASVAPDASIMAVKVLNCSGIGSFADIMDGIVYAADAGADVINLSLGAYFSKASPGAAFLLTALRRAILYADWRGATVVAAAGNDAIDLDADAHLVHVPSQLGGVVSVGATAPVAQADFDLPATYTNYGITGTDLVAPGGDLLANGICGFSPIYRCDLLISTLSSFVAPGNGTSYYAASGGTSFAAPHVAGAVAVLRSSTSGPVDALCVVKGADDLGPIGTDPFYGKGRLNVLDALSCGT